MKLLAVVLLLAYAAASLAAPVPIQIANFREVTASKDTLVPTAVTAGGNVYFVGVDDVHGTELWVAPGPDVKEAHMLSDLTAGKTGSLVKSMLVTNNQDLYVIASDASLGDNSAQLYVVTGEDIQQITPLYEGLEEDACAGSVTANPGLAKLGDKTVFFRSTVVNNVQQCNQLWVADTSDGAELLSLVKIIDTNDYIKSIVGLNTGAVGIAYFITGRGTVWATAGTSDSTIQVKAFDVAGPGQSVENLTPCGSFMYWTVRDGTDVSIWSSKEGSPNARKVYATELTNYITNLVCSDDNKHNLFFLFQLGTNPPAVMKGFFETESTDAIDVTAFELPIAQSKPVAAGNKLFFSTEGGLNTDVSALMVSQTPTNFSNAVAQSPLKKPIEFIHAVDRDVDNPIVYFSTPLYANNTGAIVYRSDGTVKGTFAVYAHQHDTIVQVPNIVRASSSSLIATDASDSVVIFVSEFDFDAKLPVLAGVYVIKGCGNGVKATTETCDGTACCNDQCGIEDQGVQCGGLCTSTQLVCDGKSATCPAGNRLNINTVCRKAAGPCDMSEVCNGWDVSCPGDNLYGPQKLCRIAASKCDISEFCAGTGAACPANQFAPASTTCDFQGIKCKKDSPPHCAGNSAECVCEAKSNNGGGGGNQVGVALGVTFTLIIVAVLGFFGYKKYKEQTAYTGVHSSLEGGGGKYQTFN